MNADRLLSHFEKISDAPDAVERLRRFTRSLAVRGLLVGGNEPVFLPRESDSVSEVNDEFPWELPRSWKWTSVSSTADYRFGKMLDKAKNRGTPRRYLRNVNVRWYDFDLTDVLEMRFEDDELPEYSLHRGDVLICEGGEPGRAAIWDEREEGLLFQKAIHRVRFGSTVTPSFFLLALREAADSGRLSKLFTGVTIKHLTGKGLGRFAFPLPPLAEQHRIVEKVDELMQLCDRLEASQAERESRRDRLVVSSLNRLGNPSGSDRDEFKKDAGFHLRNLNRLSTKPEHIKEIRKAILNLAVRGKLVPQDEKEGTAEELLAAIRDEQTLASQSKKRTFVGECGEVLDEEPYPLPASWRWIRLRTMIVQSDSGWSPKTEGSPRTGDEWGVLKVSAVSWDVFKPEENKQLPQGANPPDAAIVRLGDFLISRANTSQLIAKSVVVTEAPHNLIMSDKIVRLHLVGNSNPHFLKMVNNDADFARAYYAAHATGTSLSMKNVSRDVIYDLPIPLPPLAEQKRIVAKVDELMAICDQLEKQLESQQKGRRRLLEALLHEALEEVG